MKIHVLGSRGSMPTGGKEYSVFGQDTTALLIETDREAIFLDCGTGICHALDVDDKNISIIISHPHLDHLLGLSFFPYLNKNVDINIYGMQGLREAIDKLFSPPLWPCGIFCYKANVKVHTLGNKLKLNDVLIETIQGNHPGDALIIKVSNSGKSLVFATDYEHSKDSDKRLINFIKNTDLLIYDGQYTNEEYESCKGFGHSTKEIGMEIAKKAGVNRLMFTHHSPYHEDKFLQKEEERIKKIMDYAGILKQGDVLLL